MQDQKLKIKDMDDVWNTAYSWNEGQSDEPQNKIQQKSQAKKAKIHLV